MTSLNVTGCRGNLLHFAPLHINTAQRALCWLASLFKLIGSFMYAFCVHVSVIDIILSVQLRKVLLIYITADGVVFLFVCFFVLYKVLCFCIDAISWFVMIAIQLEGIKSCPFIFSITLRSFTIFFLWATIGFENRGIMDQMFDFGFWALVLALLLSVTVQHFVNWAPVIGCLYKQIHSLIEKQLKVLLWKDVVYIILYYIVVLQMMLMGEVWRIWKVVIRSVVWEK